MSRISFLKTPYYILHTDKMSECVKKLYGYLVSRPKQWRISTKIIASDLERPESTIRRWKSELNKKGFLRGWTVVEARRKELEEDYLLKKSRYQKSHKFEHNELVFFDKTVKNERCVQKRTPANPENISTSAELSRNPATSNRLSPREEISKENFLVTRNVTRAKNPKPEAQKSKEKSPGLFEIFIYRLFWFFQCFHQAFPELIMQMPKMKYIRLDAKKLIARSFAKYSRNIEEYFLCMLYIVKHCDNWSEGRYMLGLKGLSWIVRDYLTEAYRWLRLNNYNSIDELFRRICRVDGRKLLFDKKLFDNMRPLHERRKKSGKNHRKHHPEHPIHRRNKRNLQLIDVDIGKIEAQPTRY